MTELAMPKDAEILCIQLQNDVPCIWALVDPENENKNRKFRIYGTGHPIEISYNSEHHYIGTFQMANGSLIWHCFEVAIEDENKIYI